MPWLMSRKILIPLGCAFAVVALLVPTIVGSWAPIAHWTCAYNERLETGGTFVPAVLVNSPFGGRAWANGTIPPYFPGSFGYPTMWSWEDSYAQNGTASGTFNAVNVSLLKGSSALTLGPGANAPCAATYLVKPELPQYSGAYLGWTVAVVSNISDVGEITSLPLGSLKLSFENGFTMSNEPSISTCNSAARSISLLPNSVTLTVSIQFVANGANLSIPMVLPFVESYHYWFPANFGTWQVDNLSALGGPGGGWAFNFVGPCA